MDNADLKYRFGFSLLRKLCRGEKKNFVFSPLSLGTALAMLIAGLKGETKTELLGVFGRLDENTLLAKYSDLLSEKDLPLKIANKCLTDKDCEIHQAFNDFLRVNFESEVELVNFGENAGAIEANVNDWVAKKTDGMIPQLLPRGSLDGDTILVLLNAICFKGAWLKEFKPVPRLKRFTLRNGEVVKRSYITQTSKNFGFFVTDKLRLVKIPYREAEFYMLVATPRDENEHIDEVLAGMQTAEMISMAKSPMCHDTVILSMPKFKIEYNFCKVQESLEELGVSKIFNPGVGDFGNLFLKTKDPPFVSAIIHRAVIEVDEMGTKAFAASGVVTGGFTGRSPPPPVVIELNRPFCFLIMSSSDVVCFAGICADPSANQ